MEFKKTYTLKYSDLRACLITAATRDFRNYLCGVYVGNGMIASTNGFMALICENQDLTDLNVIIPRSSINSLINKLGKSHSSGIELHQVDDEYWLLQHKDNYELFKPLEGNYPDIAKIDIPKPEKYKAEAFPVFNFDYLLLFRKVAEVYTKLLAPKIYPTTQNGVAYIEVNDRVHGILLPVRSDYERE